MKIFNKEVEFVLIFYAYNLAISTPLVIVSIVIFILPSISRPNNKKRVHTETVFWQLIAFFQTTCCFIRVCKTISHVFLSCIADWSSTSFCFCQLTVELLFGLLNKASYTTGKVLVVWRALLFKSKCRTLVIVAGTHQFTN